ncbi:MAG: hypothetical protein DRJ50_09705 [Actinobacteria bacterium]|nr:MAG: hypothetical protein DRJ50_09705 [Actinomycetota bacterium]
MTTRPHETDNDDADNDDDVTDGEGEDHDTDTGADDLDNDDGDDDDGDDESGSVLTDDDLERIAKVAAEAANSVADKRINQMLAKRAKPKDDDDPDTGPSAEGRGAERYIKTVIRDEVRDLGLSAAEEKLVRKFAVQLTVTADLSAIDDEDEFAQSVVAQAAEMVGEVQSELSQSLRESKKRRGGNGTGTKKQPTKKPKGTAADDVRAQMATGAERAKKRHERT